MEIIKFTITESQGYWEVMGIGDAEVKNPPASAGDARDLGLVPGSGRSPGGGRGSSSSVLAWRIPWTEESGGLWSIGSQRVGHD